MPPVRRTYALLVAFLLTACGTTSQYVRVPDQNQRVEEQSKGRIYVIGRPFAINIMSHSTTMRVTDGGELIGSIVGRAYLCWERPPGIATIASEAAASPYGSAITLTIERGKVHYVLAHIGPKWGAGMFLVPGGGYLAVRLEVVTDEHGKAVLAGSKPPEQKSATTGRAGGLKDVNRSKRLVELVPPEGGGYSRNMVSWSRRRSSSRCFAMYSRMLASSRPTLET